MCWKICLSVLRSKSFVIRVKVLCCEPSPPGYKCKDHEVFRSWFWMSVCFVQWTAQSFVIDTFYCDMKTCSPGNGISKLSNTLKKLCRLKLRELSADVFSRCLNNSPLAIHLELNLESYLSCYLLVFLWYPIMPSPQCSAVFQVFGAVNERGRIYCPPSFRRKKVKGKKCQYSLACQAFSHWNIWRNFHFS